MRYLASSLCTLALGVGALFGVAGAAAAAARPALVEQQVVTATQCVHGGGFVHNDVTSPTGLRCVGGQFDGDPAVLGQ
ncbi:hypothetical protein CTZ27_26215 [Streptomyces griseocarneus]|nr:hypothetical protein CTZ27_26215 [Streptomyces griseocarneus]